MPNRSSPRAALAGGLLVLVAALLLLWRSTTPRDAPASVPTPGPDAAALAQGTRLDPPRARAGPADDAPHADQLPLPSCWAGLLEVDQATTLDALRAAMARGLGSDPLAAEYLAERLTAFIGADVGRALEVAALAEKAAQPELGIWLDGLKASAAVQQPAVRDRLLQTAESAKVLPENRSAALVALETQQRLDGAALQRVKALALDETLDQTAWVATRTLGRVLKEDFERTGTWKPYWNELLDVAQRTDDTAVRLLALEMPSYSNPLLEADSIAPLAKILRTDRERDVREMAAFRLGVTAAPDQALEAFRQAFPGEQDLCVRWAILRFAVRAAGAQALPLLRQFATLEPRLAQDVREFEQLYAAGNVDFERVWLGKPEHIQCIAEEGAPH